MQLANQASQLLLALAAGHFCFQKAQMATAKIKTQGFKTAVHKPMGDADATCIIYTVY